MIQPLFPLWCIFGGWGLCKGEIFYKVPQTTHKVKEKSLLCEENNSSFSVQRSITERNNGRELLIIDGYRWRVSPGCKMPHGKNNWDEKIHHKAHSMSKRREQKLPYAAIMKNECITVGSKIANWLQDLLFILCSRNYSHPQRVKDCLLIRFMVKGKREELKRSLKRKQIKIC